MNRVALKRYIQNKGEEFNRARTWDDASRAQSKGILIETTPYGRSDWFYVQEGKAIWWIYSDASDGGIWSAKGPQIKGFRINFDSEIAKALNLLLDTERQNKLKKNSYAKVK